MSLHRGRNKTYFTRKQMDWRSYLDLAFLGCGCWPLTHDAVSAQIVNFVVITKHTSLLRIFCALTFGSEVFKDFKWLWYLKMVIFMLGKLQMFQNGVLRDLHWKLKCCYNHSFAVVLSRLSCQRIAVPLCHWFINRYWSSGILAGPETLLINVRSISALSFRFVWTLLR